MKRILHSCACGVFLVTCFSYNTALKGMYSKNRKIVPVVMISADRDNSDSLLQNGLQSVISLCFGAYVMGMGYQEIQKEKISLDCLPYLAIMCMGGLVFSRGALLLKRVWDKITMQKKSCNEQESSQ